LRLNLLACLLAAVALTSVGHCTGAETYCNPLDLDYAYTRHPARPNAHVAHRSTADPVCVRYQGRYYLFATNQFGYWRSKDLYAWHFVPHIFKANASGDQVCAPAAWPTDRGLLFLPCFLKQDQMPLYVSKNPQAGIWHEAIANFQPTAWDPSFFQDDDKKLYLYWGSSNLYPLYGIEIDANHYKPVGKPVELIHLDQKKHGWEQFGEDNQNGKMDPFIEGAWMNKFKGRYYLQYGAPGTEFNIYGDGVYTSDHPLGPFTYQTHNPFSWKPTGFARGAGHGSTFADEYNNLWHVATLDISVKDTFERRIGLFPAGVDDDGVLFCDTAFGDYPHFIPNKKTDPHSNFTNWMLLSYAKAASADAATTGHEPALAFDEDIKTYWSAPDGAAGHYLMVDLGHEASVHAMQINFADEQANLWGKQTGIHHRFRVLCSNDKEHWSIALDRSKNNRDQPHAYFSLEKPITTRFLKLENIEVPTGCFAIQDFRVFGKRPTALPSTPADLKVERSQSDRRNVQLSWPKVEGAYAYAVEFGPSDDKLYSSFLVYGQEKYAMHSLNVDTPYCFRVSAVSESGVSPPGAVQMTP
jgi:xylan 1,4-beta-xylosidase